jgi:hypothetical protein
MSKKARAYLQKETPFNAEYAESAGKNNKFPIQLAILDTK